jgi:hypothetical protein
MQCEMSEEIPSPPRLHVFHLVSTVMKHFLSLSSLLFLLLIYFFLLHHDLMEGEKSLSALGENVSGLEEKSFYNPNCFRKEHEP